MLWAAPNSLKIQGSYGITDPPERQIPASHIMDTEAVRSDEADGFSYAYLTNFSLLFSKNSHLIQTADRFGRYSLNCKEENNMKAVETFLRVEHKYPLTAAQAVQFMELAGKYLRPDIYPEYELHNIYYDTEANEIAVHCLNKPEYKEKLRLRSYGDPEPGTTVYLEIKKKFREDGAKRRIPMTEKQASDYIEYGKRPEADNRQIAGEIDYIVSRCDLKPKIFIAYHRKAFSGINESDVRITFDTDIRSRTGNVSLHESGEEKYITGQDDVLMEIKVSGRYPYWLMKILSEMKLVRSSFSKYGMIYSELLRQSEEKRASAAVLTETEYRNMMNRKEKVCLVQF